MTPDTLHDSVLVFSKTWGALYLLVVFLIAALWTYWPTRADMYKSASKRPLEDEEIVR